MVAVALCLIALTPPTDIGGFALVKSGTYRIGKAELLDNPLRRVHLASFEIAKALTTNREFEGFVRATGYVTDAEHFHTGMVFQPPLPDFRWIQDRTAYWRFPNGVTRGGIKDKMDHPVTSISFHDAQEYCKWAKVRLPNLEEWEVAARAGTETDYFFGDKPDQIGKYANVWHGHDHLKADKSDGYMYTSPVGSFLPNPLGLYDIYGNVFEFCTGKLVTDKRDRTVHSRGGSWWCSPFSCCFFNSVDIGSVDIRASFSNQGFRVARSVVNSIGGTGLADRTARHP